MDLTFDRCDPREEDAVACLAEYYAELDRRFEGGFDVNLSADPDAADMIPPRGAFFVAQLDGQPVGCVGLKGTDRGYAEIKRLWVDPSRRGLGLARQLMEVAEGAARDLNIRVLRLDTHRSLPEAVRFYRKAGWAEIERFNDDPYPDYFFEKVL